ncbi:MULTISPECIES: hypothetical protein [Mycolicibacter]|uniref:Uncharacterized protein n=1 Tax=Mycolicibacter longobardus TaxID=1108812 RepID=A0A1X1YAJ2_9MYCO|nr:MULTISPECIES: hypothetical protein [Mycolicibacter]ORW08123.1 hypothetical protein AWC16_20565 [Mycolicibacter longobardus]RAV04251.1 hypothetical protein DQP56_00060 [Mycolicibacter senuensis]
MSQTIGSIAAMIPPHEAQLAVAKVLAALGGQFDWDSDTTANVADAVAHIGQYLPGVPSYFNQNDEAVTFWQNLH